METKSTSSTSSSTTQKKGETISTPDSPQVPHLTLNLKEQDLKKANEANNSRQESNDGLVFEKEPTSEVLFRTIRTGLIERANESGAPLISPRKASALSADMRRKMYKDPKAIQNHPVLSQSSTALTQITSSIAAPNMTDVLRCISSAIFYHLKSGHESPNKKFFEIFDERKHPISKNETINYDECPAVDDVYGFISKIFRVEKLPTEVAILGLAYMERVISLTNLTLHASNWRRVIMASLMLASKVWEDLAVWNVDFITVFPAVTVADLNTLENNLLHLLNFDAGVTRQYYAQYYFALRELAAENKVQLDELDTTKVERIESNSSKTTQRMQQLQRTKSSEALITPYHGHGHGHHHGGAAGHHVLNQST
eukprot:TRINITY_DN373_c0_g1_i1.p1 TRINITY_DN373_c0_g1~~TRINITY_DN373_c0_g1_i1.p1  ORF type:complete len:370 (-),score=84.02 TRINITY_DN373_c0_g1_i1:53-1162(-)